jgi:hypothetical protein
MRTTILMATKFGDSWQVKWFCIPVIAINTKLLLERKPNLTRHYSLLRPNWPIKMQKNFISNNSKTCLRLIPPLKLMALISENSTKSTKNYKND